MNHGNHPSQGVRSRERSPLRPLRSSTSYGSFGIPRPPGLSPPPPYSTHSGSGFPSLFPASHILTNKWKTNRSIIFFLIVVLQAVAFIIFYDLPSKIDQYNRTMARMREERGVMREEAQHLQTERIALRSEATRLGGERLAFESATRKMEEERGALVSATRKMEEERDALESAIRRSELERSRLEREKGELRRERERWEKAREDRVPQGAFWEVVQPALDCRSYGKREYWGILQNIPRDWTDVDACSNMPVEIEGVSLRRPYRCAYVEGSPYIHGYWMVDWGQPDCKPWLRDFHDKGCTNPGSGARRIEAQVVGILNKKEQDWRLLCGSTPMTWNHVTYDRPTHCDDRRYGRKVAMWDIPDGSC